MNAVSGVRTGLVLGSSSPRRSALLRQIGADFELRTAETDETIFGSPGPGEYVSAIARRKAKAISLLIAGDNNLWAKYERVIIICADTIVVERGGGILGKPKDDADAKRMLKLLSGSWHEVYTGVALKETRKPRSADPNADVRSAVGDADYRSAIGNADDVDSDDANAYADASANADDKGAVADGHTTAGELVEFEKTRVKMCEISDETIDSYIASGEPYGKAGAYAVQGAGSLFIERVDGCYYNVVGLPLHLLNSMLGVLGYNLIKRASLTAPPATHVGSRK